jgi:hypothetical protein
MLSFLFALAAIATPILDCQLPSECTTTDCCGRFVNVTKNPKGNFIYLGCKADAPSVCQGGRQFKYEDEVRNVIIKHMGTGCEIKPEFKNCKPAN